MTSPAFALARREARKKVTAVHKANVLRVSDGLFLEYAPSRRNIPTSRRGKDRHAMAALLVRDAGNRLV
jgi:3-isopropylmalate dehydrogenase